MAIVGRFDDDSEAGSLLSRLKGQHIDVFVAHEEGQTVVRVHEIDLRDVLAITPIRHPEGNLASLDPISPCPECGSLDVQRTPRLAIFTLTVLSLVGFGVAVGIESLAVALLLPSVAFAAFLLDPLKCIACSHGWKPELEDHEMVDLIPGSSDDEPEVEYILPHARGGSEN
ncbi:MAG TPA: hypothetical protein VHL58_04875 [Thermoanaerobaculia bacterium]|nr:hypothetical protein [Thermoanaerobaculia bacterium]